MYYESELRFLTDIFNKCRLQTLILDYSAVMDNRIDYGLRQLVGNDSSYQKTVEDFFCELEADTVYKFVDGLSCHYILFLLPNTEKKSVLCIGPYLSAELTSSHILEKAENFGIDPKSAKQLESCYGGLPCFPETSRIFTVLDVFLDRVFGGSNNYTMVDVNRETSKLDFSQQKKDPSDPEISAMNMKMMEARYAYENELIQAVSQGQAHKAGIILSNFSHLSFETRLSDPVRNLKNYCIIMNTLLRKAAENGGVHPIYLDSISSTFARKIEQLINTESVQNLMVEMFKSYCRLVKKHSMKQYSAPVQKAIIYIDSDLTANLTLSAIAQNQNISASYLSWLFKQETGETLTEHVNQKRIKKAMKLLETTHLQVQTVAQHCGILDVQYFSKVFKRHTGKTPKEYRESNKG